jgi:hypothetical protein
MKTIKGKYDDGGKMERSKEWGEEERVYVNRETEKEGKKKERKE